MKIKINWRELGKQLWNAVKPVLLGAIGGGLVAVTGSGCSALTPSAKTQTMSLYAIGTFSLHGGSALPTRGFGSPYTEGLTLLHGKNDFPARVRRG